jgi:hypothetical protein
MNSIGTILYLLIGIVQFFAEWTRILVGNTLVFAGPIAFVVAYIPLVGSIVGMVGAVDVWHWTWWQAGLLFFGGLCITFLFGGMSVLIQNLSNRKSRKTSKG